MRFRASSIRRLVTCGFLAAGLMVGLAGQAYGQSSLVPPGSGTEADPYQISELGHLVWMSDTVTDSAGKYYVMTANIDASATAGWNDEGTTTDVLEGFRPIGGYINHNALSFCGVFDGNGHVISGLVINRPGTSYVGLFGMTGDGGQVRNLGIVGGSITGGLNAGGLIGMNYLGTVSNCYATASVVAEYNAGGLAGRNYYATISNCYATGATTGSRAGGLVGHNYYGTVSNCYATGMAAGGHGGGLIAYNLLSTVSSSYWDVEASGTMYSAGGTGKTTAEMKQQATFEGWDFAGVWAIAEGASYPYLRVSPPVFKLTVNITGTGNVAVDPVSADGTYAPGTSVTLSATPIDAVNAFLGWEGAVSTNTPTVTMVMDVNKSVKAVFEGNTAIHSVAELAKIGTDPAYPLTGHYYLAGDIDASETAGWNDDGTTTDILEGFKPIGAYSYTDTTGFQGVFDGKGHSIRGLVINRPGEDCVGLFGDVGTGGQVWNVGLVGGSISVAAGSGCQPWAMGALVGNNRGTVSNCYASAKVVGVASSIGGLVGYNERGIVSNSYVHGVVEGYYFVGGLIGTNSGTVSNCYAVESVTGMGCCIGGLIGYGCVSGAGYLCSTTVSNSYWDMETSGQSASFGGTGKRTAEMKQQATFEGWDFTTIWGINENVSYPYLRGMLADSDGDGVIDQVDACPGTVQGATVDGQGCPPVIPGDFDRDGDVDSADLGVFRGCVSGAAVAYAGGCGSADFDRDNDVDQEDFGIFQRCYSGEGNPADPNCGN